MRAAVMLVCVLAAMSCVTDAATEPVDRLEDDPVLELILDLADLEAEARDEPMSLIESRIPEPECLGAACGHPD